MTLWCEDKKYSIMGVDTRAVIRKDTSLNDLSNFMIKKYDNVLVRHSGVSEYYFNIIFNVGENRRSMNCFFNNYAKSDYGIDGVLISLGHNEEAVNVLTNVCYEFGGYLDENDCDNIGFEPINKEKFHSPHKEAVHPFENELLALLGQEKSNVVWGLLNKYKIFQPTNKK